MKATVEIAYDDTSRNRKVELEIRDGIKSPQARLNAIYKAIGKLCGDDKDWTHWYLIDLGGP